MAFGPRRVELRGLLTCLHAAIERRAAFGFGPLRPEPVARARQLPRRLEVTAAGGPGRPDVCGLSRAREAFALPVEGVRIGVLRRGPCVDACDQH